MYSLDLKDISLETFKEFLLSKELLPGRRMLHADLDGRFKHIASGGIKNLSDLKKALASPDKLRAFSRAADVSEEYLALLKREAGSLEQKPLPVISFLHMDAETAARLHSAGIKTSRDYYEFYTAAPHEAAQKIGIEPDTAKELFSLSDLIRINGVGAAAARTFFEAGFHSVFDLANADAGEMLKRTAAVNNMKHYYNAKLGIKDMQFCIDYAKILLRFSSE
jgi:predicted flap endonuclease-1-like 5' DNA nuclease